MAPAGFRAAVLGGYLGRRLPGGAGGPGGADGVPCPWGIGFDATCSLVVLDAAGGPVSVSPDGEAEQDVVLWMDHRAAAEAEAINAAPHAVLRHVGGRISLEMQVPKLLWLRRHLPGCWQRAAHLLDLPDFLTWRATDSLTRSLCSTVCKWTYRGEEGRWERLEFARRERFSREAVPDAP